MSKLAANVTLVIAALQALLVLLVAFGVDLSSAQKDAITGATTALLALVALYFHPSVPVGKTTP